MTIINTHTFQEPPDAAQFQPTSLAELADDLREIAEAVAAAQRPLSVEAADGLAWQALACAEALARALRGARIMRAVDGSDGSVWYAAQ